VPPPSGSLVRIKRNLLIFPSLLPAPIFFFLVIFMKAFRAPKLGKDQKHFKGNENKTY
jgi:hypothetical protein